MKVFIVTDNRYPNNDAPSVRLHLLAKMLKEHGHEVLVYSRCVASKEGCNDGVDYISLRGEYKTVIGNLHHYYIQYGKTIKRSIKEQKPDAILVATSLSSFLLKWLKKHRKKYGYQLFHDCVEWYSKEEFAHPYLSFDYMKKELWLKHLLLSDVKIIAISRYLMDYYKRNNIDCAYIPSVCDVDKSFSLQTNHDKTIIFYAGSPGNKDHFAEVFRAVFQMDKEKREKLQFRIAGASKEQFLTNAQMSESEFAHIEETFYFMGRISREQVHEELCNADYTILIRPAEQRYAMAGFPTKVPESLSAGTPVICNYTSDLEMYLKHGENAVVVSDKTADGVLQGLYDAIELKESNASEMRKCARETAEKHFDYRNWGQVLNNFMNI